MFNLFKYFITSLIFTASKVEARYNDFTPESGMGDGLLIAGFIMIFGAYDYVKREYKKSKEKGFNAILIVGIASVVVYIFPVIGYALAAYILLCIIWLGITGR